MMMPPWDRFQRMGQKYQDHETPPPPVGANSKDAYISGLLQSRKLRKLGMFTKIALGANDVPSPRRRHPHPYLASFPGAANQIGT